uniref:Prolyl 4-hydroxylase alpha subunit domain-containing protein n=1 Tax=Triticum urartu TaxID=4572 RepID=A0A8R7PFS4_TRIUA
MATRSRARRLLPLLTFVALGMVLGSLLQLAFFRRLDDHSHTGHFDNDQEAADLRLGYVKPEVISWKPRIIVFHNFLSSEECDYLREIARPRLEISTVVDVATGKGVKSDVRTSSGMFVNSEERKFPVIKREYLLNSCLYGHDGTIVYTRCSILVHYLAMIHSAFDYHWQCHGNREADFCILTDTCRKWGTHPSIAV